MRFRVFAPVLFMIVTAAAAVGMCAAQADRQSTVPVSHPTAGRQPTSAKGSPAEEGERVFTQNCSRCHNAPEGFSPRISGTIARHMRVRANLSREDEQALRRFLNP